MVDAVLGCVRNHPVIHEDTRLKDRDYERFLDSFIAGVEGDPSVDTDDREHGDAVVTEQPTVDDGDNQLPVRRKGKKLDGRATFSPVGKRKRREPDFDSEIEAEMETEFLPNKKHKSFKHPEGE